MQEDVDIVTARVIALLPPSSRKRLDDALSRRRMWPSDAMKPYRAGAGELDGLTLMVESKRGRLASMVWISGKARWERHALHLTMDVPDTLIVAMRRKPLDSIVAHPLLAGLVVTSARRDGKNVIIETGRLPLAPVAGIASTGVDRPVDLIETLRARGVTEVCRVAADLVHTIPYATRHLLASRLAAAGKSAISDLVGWKPNGALGMSVYVHEGRLHATVQFTVGQFNAGSLSIHGSSRTNGRLLTGPFYRFKARQSNRYRTRLEKPYVTLDAFAEMMQPRELARAA